MMHGCIIVMMSRVERMIVGVLHAFFPCEYSAHSSRSMYIVEVQVFSCEDAAQQVLMSSVCLSVCGQVEFHSLL